MQWATLAAATVFLGLPAGMAPAVLEPGLARELSSLAEGAGALTAPTTAPISAPMTAPELPPLDAALAKPDKPDTAPRGLVFSPAGMGFVEGVSGQRSPVASAAWKSALAANRASNSNGLDGITNTLSRTGAQHGTWTGAASTQATQADAQASLHAAAGVGDLALAGWVEDDTAPALTHESLASAGGIVGKAVQAAANETGRTVNGVLANSLTDTFAQSAGGPLGAFDSSRSGPAAWQASNPPNTHTTRSTPSEPLLDSAAVLAVLGTPAAEAAPGAFPAAGPATPRAEVAEPGALALVALALACGLMAAPRRSNKTA